MAAPCSSQRQRAPQERTDRRHNELPREVWAPEGRRS